MRALRFRRDSSLPPAQLLVRAHSTVRYRQLHRYRAPCIALGACRAMQVGECVLGTIR